MKFSDASSGAGFRSGRTLITIRRTRSIPMTEGVALILKTRVDIISRLLPDPMAAAPELFLYAPVQRLSHHLRTRLNKKWSGGGGLSNLTPPNCASP